jgi:hypothetical protein
MQSSDLTMSMFWPAIGFFYIHEVNRKSHSCMGLCGKSDNNAAHYFNPVRVLGRTIIRIRGIRDDRSRRLTESLRTVPD